MKKVSVFPVSVSALFFGLLLGCSNINTANSASVSFRFDGTAILSAASRSALSRNGDTASGSEEEWQPSMNLQLALYGDGTAKMRDIPISAASVEATFDNVPVGRKIYARAIVCEYEEGAAEKSGSLAFYGETDTIEVQPGSNELTLALAPLGSGEALREPFSGLSAVDSRLYRLTPYDSNQYVVTDESGTLLSAGNFVIESRNSDNNPSLLSITETLYQPEEGGGYQLVKNPMTSRVPVDGFENFAFTTANNVTLYFGRLYKVNLSFDGEKSLSDVGGWAFGEDSTAAAAFVSNIQTAFEGAGYVVTTPLVVDSPSGTYTGSYSNGHLFLDFMLSGSAATQTSVAAFPSSYKNRQVAAWYSFYDEENSKTKTLSLYLFSDGSVISTARKEKKNSSGSVVVTNRLDKSGRYTVAQPGDFENNSGLVTFGSGENQEQFTFSIVDGTLFAITPQADSSQIPSVQIFVKRSDSIPLAEDFGEDSGSDAYVGLSVTITESPENDISVAKAQDENEPGLLTFTADEGYAGYRWTVDGQEMESSAERPHVLNLDIGAWKKGIYNLYLVAEDAAGNAYSYTAQIAWDGATASVTYYLSADGDDDTGDGSEEKPFASLAAATALMNNAGCDYTVKVSGIITSGPNYLLRDIEAKSLTISGSSDLDAEGLPQDGFDRELAGSANSVSEGMVLVVSTPVPVTIENLKISGGYGGGDSSTDSYYAGGITISQEATVSLGNGVLVTENRNPSNGRGGAIHNEGRLFVYGSAVIGDATNGGKSDPELYDYASDSSSYNDFTGKKMANYATSGGGIYNGRGDGLVAAKVYLGYRPDENGNPVKERLTGGLYYNSGNGGALYNDEASFVYFASGTFAWNGTSITGGAVYNQGWFEMTGGQMLHNRAMGTSETYGGAVYNASSSAVFALGGGTINHNLAYRNYSYGDKSYGGAVYNAGSFYMYGTAVIGEKDAVEAASLDEDHESDTKTEAWGNKALYGGAIYNDVNTASNKNGSVYLGYKPTAEGEPAEAALTGGIYYNFASYDQTQQSAGSQYGGGAIASKGSICIASGTIAHNATRGNGGAIDLLSAVSMSIIGGTIRNNWAELSGGAIYLYEDSSTSLTLSGDLLIPAGVSNDVYVSANSTTSESASAKIIIAGPLSADFAARLVPAAYVEGRQIVTLAAGADTTLEAECEKFAVSDEVDEETGTRRNWGISESGKLTSTSPQGSLSMTIEHGDYGDLTLTARYYEDEAAWSASLSGDSSDSGSDFTATSSVPAGKFLVFTASLPDGTVAAESGYSWYVDNAQQDSLSASCPVDSSGWAAGIYDIAVEVRDQAGTSYSAECHISLQ